MAAFTITPVEKGILRCKHTGHMNHEDVRSLAAFLHDYRGKLLVDLTGTIGDECTRNIEEFRPMMPTTAIFGADIDLKILELSEVYYTHRVQYFKSEAEALAWLHTA